MRVVVDMCRAIAAIRGPYTKTTAQELADVLKCSKDTVWARVYKMARAPCKRRYLAHFDAETGTSTMLTPGKASGVQLTKLGRALLTEYEGVPTAAIPGSKRTKILFTPLD